MSKRIFLILLIFLTFGTALAQYTPYLQKGALIKVFTKKPLSTDNLEEGSIVYFIAPSDVWVLEKKAIEKGDIFVGYVDMLKMPILGVNAAMSIKIKKIIKVDGQRHDIEGKIIFSNSQEILGGTLTNPASYNKSFHPRKVYRGIWAGTLQYVPSGEYEQGSHVGINSRDTVFVQLDEDYYI